VSCAWRIKFTLTIGLALSMSVGVLAQSVRVGVLGLFHPDQIILGVPSGSALILRAGQKTLVLEPSAGAGAAHMRLSGDTIVVDAGSGSMRGHDVIVRARQNGAADFTLAIPGKITRHYLGTLQLKRMPVAGSHRQHGSGDRGSLRRCRRVRARHAFGSPESPAVATVLTSLRPGDGTTISISVTRRTASFCVTRRFWARRSLKLSQRRAAWCSLTGPNRFP